MSREIVIASRNRGKIAEIIRIFHDLPFRFTTVGDYPEVPEIEETGSTFAENARLKAVEVARRTGQWALSDDSGLEVDALGGRPGIHSARYAGPKASDEENNAKLAAELDPVPDGKRAARYRAVLVLASPDGRIVAEADGACEGHIGRVPKGTAGFGYDPLFVLPDLGQTFAELGLEIKNRISHRAQALERLRDKLRDLQVPL